MMQDSNVIQIEAELEKSIARRNYEEPISFDEIQKVHPAFKVEMGYSQKELQKSFDYINNNWKVGNDTSMDSKGLIKRVIKKMTDFVVAPILRLQSTYNAQNARCIGQMKEYLIEIERCQKRITELEAKIDEIENRNSAK